MKRPLVSFLMPSRGRIHLAQKSIESLHSKPGNFEILIAVDDNDPNLEEYKKLKSKRVRVYVTTQYGYERLYEYYNLLAKKAKGDWLMLWNDDATMTTTDWQQEVDQYDPKEPLVLDAWHGTGNLFPILSRKFYEILGYFAQSAHSDSWPEDIAVRADVQVELPLIHIEHLGESLSDETHNRVREVTPDTKKEFYNEENTAWRERDAQKIISYIKECENANRYKMSLLFSD